MAIKKSELYSSLWASCDALRGSMDASQYKDYVLVLLFIKYISDKYSGVPYAPIIVPPGASFTDMVALKGKPTIGDDINKKIIAKIADANKLNGTIDVADFNNAEKLGSGKEMVDKLSDLIGIFENSALDFSRNQADGDDILGDAYEYLMRHFATESGKSKGQFYTPAEVSRIMAKIIGVAHHANPSTTVYDPTCGSGSLLLKVSDEAALQGGLSLFGQENDSATAALARMNMILHNCPTAVINLGNTLSNPLFTESPEKLKTFDFVVANPPFSYKSWTQGFAVSKGSITDSFERFKDYGIPPTKNGDYAFLLHIIKSLKTTGKGAVILPHGVLFRGNAEADIRRKIIRKGYIKGIIGLPPNLFYGTGIPACIIVIDKEHADTRKSIMMIDASKGFMKDGNKNRLREQDIHRIVDVFTKELEIDKYSRIVPFEEIEKNEYNLNIPRYIDSQEEEDIQNIEAHLLGGIPNADIDALHHYWEVYPSLKNSLFAAGDRPGFSRLAVALDDIKNAVYTHPEFATYSHKVMEIFKLWKAETEKRLFVLSSADRPKTLVKEISESMLQSFTSLRLIDPYDMYQHLMTYWIETMQDDVYSIVGEGWAAARDIERDAKKKTEWEGRIIPKDIIIQTYFPQENAVLEELEIARDDITRQLEEMEEEHGDDEGLLNDARNEKDKITKAAVQKRLREIIKDTDAADEITVLQDYLALCERESDMNREIKEKAIALEKIVIQKYEELTDEEIKELVITLKWMEAIEQDVKAEMERISHRLTARIRELAERYESTLSQLTEAVNDLEKQVYTHLEKMGYSWPH